MTIDWKIVEQHLYCPICGDKAHISPESDGRQGEHRHYFSLSREKAQEISDAHKSTRCKLNDLLDDMNALEIQQVLTTIKSWR